MGRVPRTLGVCEIRILSLIPEKVSSYGGRPIIDLHQLVLAHAVIEQFGNELSGSLIKPTRFRFRTILCVCAILLFQQMSMLSVKSI